MNDGAPPRPDPKAIRGSLVDKGWSVIPPPVSDTPSDPLGMPQARPLPSYQAHEAGTREVSAGNGELQSRAKALREKDTLPPPRRASAFPPALPAVAAGVVAGAQEPPPGLSRGPDPAASPLPAARPAVATRPPPTRPSAPPAPTHPSVATARPPMPPARPSEPPPPPASALATPQPDSQALAVARSAAAQARPRVSQSPPALPSFAGALSQRVRFAGGEVPLWSLVTPLVLLVALGAAFAAAAVTSGSDPGAAQGAPSASADGSTRALPAPAASLATNAEEKPKALGLLERVAQGDDAAVKELSGKPVADLSVDEAISLSIGQSAEEARAARALRDRVDHDPGLIKDPDVLARLRRYSDDPETARDALSAMANVPGPISADLIYEVWTATSSRTTATDLARSLLYTKEVRAKASPALSVALDLRDADSCEKNRGLLPRASTDGDRRAFHLLVKLTRKYGCGPDKRADCFACLRSGTNLDDAMKAVKARREPRPFSGG